MIKVLCRRGITLFFLNIIDSCEVKVKDSDYIFMQVKWLIIRLHIKMLIKLIVCPHPAACY